MWRILRYRWWPGSRRETRCCPVGFSGRSTLAGKAAIVEASVGQGSVVLFGFQPDYRGQTVTTWPLLFNALAGKE